MADEIDISRADFSRDEQLILLRSSVEQWNAWRQAHPKTLPDLAKADLSGANLFRVNLSGADMRQANLTEVDLTEANLEQADLSQAILTEAYLDEADLREADLREADLRQAHLFRAVLTGAHLSGANLRGAKLIEANLIGASLIGVDLREADLREADLGGAVLIETSLIDATLDGCNVYGISVWKVQLDGAKQTNLRITPGDEPAIKVDDLRVAQFLYLLLDNQETRAVLDVITSKVILILGRFSVERKPALDELRAALRQHPNGYIPVLFDFEAQTDKPVLETVKILANLARFIIADLTDPNMVRSELTVITEHIPTVPVQPLIEGDAKLPTEYSTWRQYRSFLQEYRYTDLQQLLANLNDAVIAPAEKHVQARRLTDAN